MIFILNSLPIQALDGEKASLKIKRISPEEAKILLGGETFTSAVGHKATAEVLSAILGVEIPENRIEIKFRSGDKLLIGTLRRRLQEGQVLQHLSPEDVVLFWVEVE